MVPYGSTQTEQQQIFVQAQQGNPEAIAYLLNRALNPQGVQAQVYPEVAGLTVVLQAAQVPSQQYLVPFIQQGLSQLGIPDVQRVRVVGIQAGQPDYAWQEAIALPPRPNSLSPAVSRSGFPITQFEVGNGTAAGQQIIYGDKSLQLTSHGAVVMAGAAHHPPNIRPSPAPEPSTSITPPAQMVGRQDEIQGAIAALQISQPVEFYGDPGLGKTTLLRALVHHPTIQSLCPDGIVYHSAQDQPLDDLLQALFQRFFTYDEPLSRRPTTDQIYHAFRGRRALIALDDLQLHPAQVNALASQLPSVHLLMAGSQHHALPESFAMSLGGLSLPEAIALLETQLGYGLGHEDQIPAEALWRLLQGHPLRLRQAIALVRHRHLTLAGLVQALQKPIPLEALLLRSCSTLPEPERRILAALGVLGIVPVRGHHFAGMTGVSNPQGALDHLIQRGLLTTDGSHYTLAANLLPLLRQHWNLAGWVQPLMNYFLLWIQKHGPVTGALVQEAPLLLGVMQQAAAHQQWSEVLRLARTMDGPFMVSGQWSCWGQIWQLGLQAAEALGDREAIAHAYHQLGTRALCLEDPFTANSYLTQAMLIREAISQTTAAHASYHNLQWLSPGEPIVQEGPGPRAQTVQPSPETTVAAVMGQPLEAEPAPEQRQSLPPAAQVGLIAAAFLGLGGLLTWQLYRNPPGLSVSPAQLQFRADELNKTSTPQAITIQNTGEGLLEITRVDLAGNNPLDFQIASNGCEGIPLAPDRSCLIQVTFTPQEIGNRSAELTVRDRNRTVEQRIFLSGSGPSNNNSNNPVTLSFEPGNLDFGDYAINQTSEPRRIVLRNESRQAVTIQGISPIGEGRTDFPTTHDCTGAPLAAGQSCSIYVTFRPSAGGRRAANLAITDTANNLWNVPLVGNGANTQPQAPALSLRPGSLTFGDRPVQTTSNEQLITLSNSGNQTLTISQVYLEGNQGFSIRRNTCTRNPLAPGNACTVGIVFTPQEGGALSAQLTVASNDPRGSARVFLAGTGTVPTVAELNVNPINLNFGVVELESSSSPQTVTIRNRGNGTLSIGGIGTSGNGDFVGDNGGSIGQNCSNRQLGPGEECRFGVVFLPYVEGDRVAQITIPSNAPQGSVAVQLRGQGQVRRFPTLSVSPSNLSFGTVLVGESSSPQTVTLFNSGGAPLTTGNLAIGGADPNDFVAASGGNFTQIACSNTTLQPGQRCQVQVTFGPLAPGDRQAQLFIPSDDPNGDLRINLTGVGGGEAVPPIMPR